MFKQNGIPFETDTVHTVGNLEILFVHTGQCDKYNYYVSMGIIRLLYNL